MRNQYIIDLKDLKRIRKMLTLAETAIAEIIMVKQIKLAPSNDLGSAQTDLIEAKWQTGYQLNLFEQTGLTEKECEF
ncbi:MAG: hypothetical protein IPK04_20120 [Bdellovibrionales bacterium]|jgi:hypothetical protein|nr:hypothetical protein [Bdellovibrionales bacterium]